MFVRCERCRAVFEADDARVAAASAVACGRCDHVFTPRPAQFLGVLGVIGGAAADSDVPGADEITAPRIRMKKGDEPTDKPNKRQKFRGGSLVLLFASGLALAAAGSWGLRAFVGEVPPASPESLAQHRRGLELLHLDDDASLEQSVAAFGVAALGAPEHREFRAFRVISTTLLAASLRDRARDLSLELEALEREVAQVQDEAADGYLIRVADMRERIADVQESLGTTQLRGDSLMRDASSELAALVAAPARNGATEVALAQALFTAASRQVDQTDEALRPLAGHAEVAAFMQLARGMARVGGSPDAARAAEARAFLSAAVDTDPSLLRARVLLARLALTRPTPDPVDAARQLEAVRDANHDHASVDVLVARADRLRQKIEAAALAVNPD